MSPTDTTQPATKLDLSELRTAFTQMVGDLRAEMLKGFSEQIKWIMGAAIGLGAVGLTVITFVLNNAVPKAPPAAPAPIVIYANPAPPK